MENLMKGKLKVNLHLTQACNYHCRHCFAMFPEPRDLSPERWKDIISDLAESGLVSAINFAGGEPVFCRGFPEIVSFAHDKGFLLSIITNGSLLRNEKLFPRELFPMISMFGFSIDSLNYDTLRRIGRYDSRGNILGRQGFIDTVRLIRECSPSASIKINTVVSKLNWNERLVDIEEEVPVSRWKFLKMKVFETNGFSNRDLAVTESEFESFVRNNRRRYGETVVESTMERSYLIIDNAGTSSTTAATPTRSSVTSSRSPSASTSHASALMTGSTQGATQRQNESFAQDSMRPRRQHHPEEHAAFSPGDASPGPNTSISRNPYIAWGSACVRSGQ